MNIPSYFDFGENQTIESSNNSTSSNLSICINGIGVDGKLSLSIIIVQFGIILSLFIVLMILQLKKYSQIQIIYLLIYFLNIYLIKKKKHLF